MTCPQCGSAETHFRKVRCDWCCDVCEYNWTESSDATPVGEKRSRLFLSYGRRDAEALAHRLACDLRTAGHEVWLDKHQIKAGQEWEGEIRDGLSSTQVVIALLSPHAVRIRRRDAGDDEIDGVCLDEISFARFTRPPIPIVPAMAIPCEPPFCIFRLDYVDLCGWNDSENRYQAGLQRLVASIEDARAGRIRYRSYVHNLKPLDSVFASYVEEKRRDFHGREWLFERIDQWRSSDSPVMLITGDPGVGKSALVAQLVHQMTDQQVLAYHFCRADTKETLRPGRFVMSIAAMIASQLPDYEELLSDDPTVRDALGEERCAADPGSAFEEGVLAPLLRLHAPKGLARYILIDALDEALMLKEEGTLVDLLEPRLSRLPRWLRVLATTRKEPDVLARLGRLRHQAEEIDAHAGDNLRDVDGYIRHRLSRETLSAAVTRSTRRADEISRELCRKADGNFLYAQLALQAIGSDPRRIEDLASLPPGLGGLYLAAFERRFPTSESYAGARRILEILVSVREAPDFELLAAASQLESEYEFPAALDSLGTYVVERDGRYSLFHRSLADWLTDSRTGRFRVSLRRGRERLADCGVHQYSGGAGQLHSYLKRHLAAHLIECERWEPLVGVLSDADLLRDATDSGRRFEWASHWQAARLRSDPVQAFRRAFDEVAPSLDPIESARRADLIGDFLRDLGCMEGALHFLEQALTLRERSLGDNHADVATSAHHLAELHRARRDFPSAHKFMDRAIGIRTRVFGEKSVEVADCYHDLGELLQDERSYGDARGAYERSLSLRRAILGEDDPKVADCLNEIGTVLYETGDLVDARKYFEEAAAIFERELPEDHPDIGVVWHHRALIAAAEGDVQTALAHEKHALAIYRRIYGPHHRNSIVILSRLVSLCSAENAYLEAVGFQRLILEARQLQLGPRHPDLLSEYRKLVDLSVRTTDPANSSQCFEEYIDHVRAVADADGVEVAVVCEQAFWWLFSNGRHREALAYAQEAIDVRRRADGESTEPTAAAWNALGRCYQELASYQEALEAFRRSLEIRQEILAPDAEEMRVSLNNVGLALVNLDLLNEAEPVLERAIACKQDNPFPWYWMAQLHRRRGDVGKERAAWVRYRELGPTSPSRAVEAEGRIRELSNDADSAS